VNEKTYDFDAIIPKAFNQDSAYIAVLFYIGKNLVKGAYR